MIKKAIFHTGKNARSSESGLAQFLMARPDNGFWFFQEYIGREMMLNSSRLKIQRRYLNFFHKRKNLYHMVVLYIYLRPYGQNLKWGIISSRMSLVHMATNESLLWDSAKIKHNPLIALKTLRASQIHSRIHNDPIWGLDEQTLLYQFNDFLYGSC